MADDYIQQLSETEKVTFVRALIFLIKSDGSFDDRERECIHEIVNIYNIKDKVAAINAPMGEDILLTEIANTINDRHKALLLIRELLTMAHVDEELGDAEVNFIEKVAAKLNIEPEKVLQINKLVLERKDWLVKSAVVMESAQFLIEEKQDVFSR